MRRYSDDLLIDYLGIKKTGELIAWKYYKPTLRADIESYIKRYDMSLAIKSITHKPYSDL